ncbi:MAG: glutamyl-tRNA reductase [Candidatus Latescibacteria bacterium]|nr:glutamyl-tRNA reductase [Candidatus Latescibacterota bacterium]
MAPRRLPYFPLQLARNFALQLITFGLNHKSAPVEIREKLAFAEPAQAAALTRLKDQYGLHEAAILSTCNRSEIYAAVHDQSGIERTRRFLAEVQGLAMEELEPHFYKYAGEDAAQHLFSVACGIDSLVVGESQILKQVSDSLKTAQQNGSAQLLINELFQRSLRVGKRARTETQIGRGRLSVSTAVVELANQIFDRLEDRQVLLLGAGEMGELTAQYLLEGGASNFLVTNRTLARATALAQRFGGEAVPFEQLATQLEKVDIAIASTAAPGFVLELDTLRQVMRQRRGRPLFLVDIAVPRDIDPQIGQLDNVFLFDIDDLEQVVASNRRNREEEIAAVRIIIDEELQAFVHWLNARGAGPLIAGLRQHADQLRQVELARWQSKLAHLSEDDRRTVEAVLRGFSNKILHAPMEQIRQFANAEDGYIRLDTVNRLFHLDREDDQESQ